VKPKWYITKEVGKIDNGGAVAATKVERQSRGKYHTTILPVLLQSAVRLSCEVFPRLIHTLSVAASDSRWGLGLRNIWNFAFFCTSQTTLNLLAPLVAET
jgi:hypothetical protein